MQAVRIHTLSGLPRKQQAILSEGQIEAAKVWSVCRDLHLQARKEHTRWSGRDTLQKATKGQFGLHSQSTQMICHAFLANVEATRERRKQGFKQMRYPYKDKSFYPLMWPSQAMGIKEGRSPCRWVAGVLR
jgi:hypothetical protein